MVGTRPTTRPTAARPSPAGSVTVSDETAQGDRAPSRLAQRGNCDLDDVGLAERGDLRGKASRAILRCAGWPARREHALKFTRATGCEHVQPLGGGSQLAGTAMASSIGLAGT